MQISWAKRSCYHMNLFEPERGILMKTYIHIGQQKTATTSIQHYMKKNKNELARQRLYVPDLIGGYTNPSHFILNVYSLDKRRFSSSKEKLMKLLPQEYFDNLHEMLKEDIAKHYRMAHAQGCEKIIWSNEGLYLLNSVREYKRLTELFEIHSQDIECICCFREPDAYRKSLMREQERSGLKPSDIKDHYRYTKPDSWLFDYSRKKNILQQVFNSNVTYIRYNVEDMVNIFLATIGCVVNGDSSIRLNQTIN